jgi:hypothetical protein
VANTQWLDRSQPQPLYTANILLYVNAVFWLFYLLLGIAGLFGLLAIPAIFAGLGIANEKKLGYWAGVVVAGLNLLMLVALFLGVPSISVIFNLLFAAALLALLLHPVSRSYERVWFKKLNSR